MMMELAGLLSPLKHAALLWWDFLKVCYDHRVLLSLIIHGHPLLLGDACLIESRNVSETSKFPYPDLCGYRGGTMPLDTTHSGKYN